MMDIRQSFAGRQRKRKTSVAVRIGEVVSRTLITVGGIGTIIAVITVCVFLVWVVVPLFRPASVGAPKQFTTEWKVNRPVHMGVDEYRVIGWALFADGKVQVFRLDTGEPLETRTLFPNRTVSAISSVSREGDIAFGFADGTVQLGRIGFATRFLKDSDIPASFHDLEAGQIAGHDGGVVSWTPEGQLRFQKIQMDLEEPIKPKGESSAIVLLDLTVRPTGPVISALTADGKLRTNSVSKREDLLTGEIVKELSGGEMTLPSRAGKEQPNQLLISGVGDNVFVVRQDG